MWKRRRSAVQALRCWTALMFLLAERRHLFRSSFFERMLKIVYQTHNSYNAHLLHSNDVQNDVLGYNIVCGVRSPVSLPRGMHWFARKSKSRSTARRIPPTVMLENVVMGRFKNGTHKITESRFGIFSRSPFSMPKAAKSTCLALY